MQFRSAKHATDGGTSRRFLDRFRTPRTSSKRRRAPMLEMLEGRTLLSIAPSLSSGALTFSEAANNEQLVLYGTSSSFTAADYASSTATIPTNTWTYPIGTGTGEVSSISVDLSGGTGTTLTLGNGNNVPWTFGVPITLTGDSTNSTTLETQATTGSHTWNLTGTYAGNIDATYSGSVLLTGVTFTQVGTLTADPGTANTLVGENTASTWTLGATSTSSTYWDGTTHGTPAVDNMVNFSGFTTVQGGVTSAGTTDTFNLNLGTTDINTNLDGDAGNDTFKFISSDGTGQLTGNIVGGTGTNTISLSQFASPATVILNSNVVSPAVNAGTIPDIMSGYFNNINTLTGNPASSDKLTGLNVTSTWTVNSSPTYTYTATVTDTDWNIHFSGFTVLQGGTGNNEFDVSTAFTGSLDGGGGVGTDVFNLDGGSVSGGIFGQSGNSTIEYPAGVTVTVTGPDSVGYTGTDSLNLSGGFSGINAVSAGAGSTLTGDSNASTWTLDASGYTYLDPSGSNSIYQLSLAFSGFGTLQGGTGNNEFDVNTAFAGTLDGGGTTTSSVTIFNVNSGGSVSNSSSHAIVGQSGNSTINYTAGGSVTVTSFDSSDSLGYSGTDTVDTGGFTGINAVTGLLGNTLKGDSTTGTTSTWTLASSGDTYEDSTTGASNLTFSGFGTLQGGTLNNTFTVSTAFTGTLDGGTGSGTDVFNLTSGGSVVGGIVGQSGKSTINYSEGVNVIVSGFDSIGYSGNDSLISGGGSLSGGFTGINTVTATTGTGSTLTGDDNASTWALDADTTGHTYGYTYQDTTNSSTTDKLTFSSFTGAELVCGFQTLQGGTGNNEFDISTAFTGTLDGGGTTGSCVTIFKLNSGGSVSNSSSHAIVGQSGNSTINYTAGGSVTVTSFDSSDSLGYSGTDTVDTGGFSGINKVTATGSGNTLKGDDQTSTWTLAAGTGGYTYKDTTGTLPLTFSGFQTLQGGAAAYTFNIKTTVSSSLILNGGTGTDSFIFANGVNLDGTITGGSGGTNTINYLAYTSPVTVNLGTGASTGTLGISNIETLVGGSNTTLVGPNNTITWTINGANSGTLKITGGSSIPIFTFRSVQNLSGGVRGNTFALGSGAGASVSGAITGGSTKDTLDLSGSSADATVNVTNNNAGNVSIAGSTVLNFSRIANVIGTTGSDNFVLSNGKGLTGTLTGSHGTGKIDTLDYHLYTTSVRVNLATGVNSATSIDGGLVNGITNIENVVGGSGNDILIGNANTTSLTDGNGNDIIVGGGGPVTIYGGRGDDIIITGGTGTDSSHMVTVYGNGGTDLMIDGSYTQAAGQPATLAALNSLMAEWDRTDVSLSTKISHLKGASHGGTAGGRNGSYDLYSGTVTLDTGAYTALYAGNLSTSIPSSKNNWFITVNSSNVNNAVSGYDTISNSLS